MRVKLACIPQLYLVLTMTRRYCFAVVILSLAAASAALPAPRILPSQTLHLDAAQVSLYLADGMPEVKLLT